MNMKSKKGFTLVELLAVIVILAVLILLAMPSVLGMMQRAQRSAFALEANRIINDAQTAYSEKIATGEANSSEDFCISVAELVGEGYMKKNIGTKTNRIYTGSVKIAASSSNNEVTLWLSNKTFFLTNIKGSEVSGANFANSDSIQATSTPAENCCGQTCSAEKITKITSYYAD